MEGRKVENKLALKLYELTGGRMVHLELAADEIKKRNKSFEGMYWRSMQRNGVDFSLYL